MKIAMFGGSFDPIHNGHVSLAHAFVDTLCLEKVLIIPTHYPPHKQKKTTVTPQQRLDMCRLAFEGEELFEVSDIEIKREGKSYTYMTLEELSIIYPDDELYLITGADMFMTIDQWKEPEIIFRHAVICGVPRDDDDISALKAQAEKLSLLGARTELLDPNIMAVSSTEIRQKISDGQKITGLVPEKVERYICENGLYADTKI